MNLDSSSEIPAALAAHGSFVRRLAKRLLSDPHDADDLVQQASLQALTTKSPPSKSLKGWLAAITRHAASRWRRENGRRERRELKVARPETTLTPSDLIERQLLICDVIDAVMRLEEPFRSTVILRFYEDKSPAEIASALCIPAATVRSRLHRGLDQLRCELDRRAGGDRASWASVLAPIVGMSGIGTAATAAGSITALVTTGTLFMAKKITIAAAVVTLAAVSYLAFQKSEQEPEKAPPIVVVENTKTTVPIANPEPERTKEATVLSPIKSTPFLDPESRGGAQARPAAALARVFGRVVNSSGQAQAEVPVTLQVSREHIITNETVSQEVTHDPKADAVTDALGRFSFTNVPIGSVAKILARPKRLCDVRRSTAVEKPGEVDLGDLVSESGGAIEGSVLDSNHRPIAGSEVGAYLIRNSTSNSATRIVMIGRQKRSDIRTAITDQRGLYKLEGLAPGEYALTSSMPGRFPVERRGVIVARDKTARDVDFTHGLGHEVQGEVKDGTGKPIAGARVSIGPAHDAPVLGVDLESLEEASIETELDGSFRFHGIPPGGYSIAVNHSEFAHVRQAIKVPAERVALELVSRPIIHGVVTALGGAPLQDFSVHAIYDLPDGLVDRTARLLRGEQAAELLGVSPIPGLFALSRLRTGSVYLKIASPGFSHQQIGPLAISGGLRKEERIELVPELTVTGTVLGPKGEPVRDAKVLLLPKLESVEALPGGGQAVRRRTFRVEVKEETGTPSDSPHTAPRLQATTNSEGRFQIKGASAGDYKIHATHDLHASAEETPLVLSPGVAAADLVLNLRGSGKLAGRVLDEEGRPIPGARIDARPIRAGAMASLRNGLAGNDGSFEIVGLHPGTWVAEIHEQQQTDATMVFAVANNEDAKEAGSERVVIEEGKTTEVLLQKPKKASISGVVTEAGRPIPGARVRLNLASSEFGFAQPEATTDNEGRFVFPQVALDTYRLAVHAKGSGLPKEVDAEVTAAREYQFDIALPSGRIEGRVVDAITQRPVIGATVATNRHEEKTEGEAKPARRSTAVMLTIEDNGSGPEPQILRIGGEEMNAVTTDQDGRYVVSFLEPGDYDLTVKSSQHVTKKLQKVHVASGDATSGTDFVLEPGASISITVEGPPDGQVVVYQAALKKAGSTELIANEIGMRRRPARFTGLAPGKYVVEVSTIETPDSIPRSGMKEFDLTPGADLPLEVKLEPTGK